MVLKIEIFFLRRALKIRCIIVFFTYFIKFETLELDDEMLEFLEFLPFNPNIQR